MQQEELWHDEFEDALWSTCEAIGPKVIARELFAERDPAEAAKMLARCLNLDRAEKLSAGQIALIIQRGREVGCHVAMAFLCERASYAAPQPLDPEDEKSRLQRQYIEAVKAQEQLIKRMERLNGGGK